MEEDDEEEEEDAGEVGLLACATTFFPFQLMTISLSPAAHRPHRNRFAPHARGAGRLCIQRGSRARRVGPWRGGDRRGDALMPSPFFSTFHKLGRWDCSVVLLIVCCVDKEYKWCCKISRKRTSPGSFRAQLAGPVARGLDHPHPQS
jgi:hypothetical protein